MRSFWILVILVLVSAACSISPEPITYGEDNCVRCEMTIMDHRYGTEIVTAKGKVYKFDSVECLVEFLEDKKDGSEEFKIVLVTPFDRPGNLVNARESHVLHSRNLPSPMGMYLTAFETENAANTFQRKHGGKVYSWEGLVGNFMVIKSLGR